MWNWCVNNTWNCHSNLVQSAPSWGYHVLMGQHGGQKDNKTGSERPWSCEFLSSTVLDSRTRHVFSWQRAKHSNSGHVELIIKTTQIPTRNPNETIIPQVWQLPEQIMVFFWITWGMEVPMFEIPTPCGWYMTIRAEHAATWCTSVKGIETQQQDQTYIKFSKYSEDMSLFLAYQYVYIYIQYISFWNIPYHLWNPYEHHFGISISTVQLTTMYHIQPGSG